MIGKRYEIRVQSMTYKTDKVAGIRRCTAAGFWNFIFVSEVKVQQIQDVSRV